MADLNESLPVPEAAPVPSATSPGTIKVPAIAVPAEPVKLFNREFSWIEFNRRVLGEAQDESVPLLERAKFLSIASNNLDEFLMVSSSWSASDRSASSSKLACRTAAPTD
jgi:polyphosphate kinase